MQAFSTFVPSRERSPLRIQRDVVLALVMRELRTRVQGQWFSLLWMLGEPLVHVLLIMALFGFRHHVTGNSDFPVFLITGMLPFFMFRNLMRRLPNAVTANLGLYAYRQVKPIDAMLARAVMEVGLSSAVYVLALLLLSWMGYECWPIEPLELAVVSAVLLGLGLSLGVLFSVLVHERPRVAAFVNLVNFPLYLLSGVILPVQSMPAQAQSVLLWNPVLHLIELARQHFLPYYKAANGINLAYPAAFTLVTAALGLALYRLNRHELTSVD